MSTDPRYALMKSTSFVVTVWQTDPPPGWEERTLEKLTAEVRNLYGTSAQVTPQ